MRIVLERATKIYLYIRGVGVLDEGAKYNTLLYICILSSKEVVIWAGMV